MSLRVVTGYVPISNHPRSAADYGAMGEQLFSQLPYPVKPFYNRVEDCWLAKRLGGQKVTHSEGDNPEKNSLAYHIVQHQKVDWLGAATLVDKEADTFVWIDYGILHVPGVTVAVIEAFLKRVYADTSGKLSIPGCWPTSTEPVDLFPCWRFCGGVMVVPRNRVKRLSEQFKKVTCDHIKKTKNVTWEVNDLARLERKVEMPHVPIRWYQADHNATMFTNYPGGTL